VADEDGKAKELVFGAGNALPGLPAAGLAFMGSHLTRALLSLILVSPLDATTHYGQDGGATPIVVSWVNDLLWALCTTATREGAAGHRVKEALWEALHSFRLDVVPLNGAILHQGQLLAANMKSLTGLPQVKSGALKTVANSLIASHSSSVGPESVVVDSHLVGPWDIGPRCFVAGIDPTFPHQSLPDDTILVQVNTTPTSRNLNSIDIGALNIFSLGFLAEGSAWGDWQVCSCDD